MQRFKNCINPQMDVALLFNIARLFCFLFHIFLFGFGLGGGLSGLVLQVFGWFGLASTKFDLCRCML